VLVQAGAGGVGTIAVQLAKSLGAEVFATCSTPNVEFVKSLGADVVIDYRNERYEERARGVDAVVDSLGAEHLPRALGTVRRGGRILALTTGLPEAAERFGPYLGLVVASFSLGRFVLSARLTKNVRVRPLSRKPCGKTLAKITELVDAGTLRPVIDSVLPVEDAAEAHRRVETGRCRGKVVLSVA
jgi:alcohol dehydrogenase